MLLFIRATFCVLLVFVDICSAIRLSWLSCQYLPSDWPERFLMVRDFVSIKPRLKYVDVLGLMYCFIVLWCVFYCNPTLRDILYTTMARCILIVLKVP